MMNTETETAKRFGVLERIETLKSDLLLCKFVQQVKFGFVAIDDKLNQVIVLAKYDIPPSSPTYYPDRHDLLEEVLHVAKEHGLSIGDDLIEDRATHFYFVFNISDKKTFYSK